MTPTPDPLATFRAADLDAMLADPARKQDVVTPMFDVIAPRYDDFTRLFSFGMDAAWKRDLVARALAAVPSPRTVLDLACGTGDLAFALAARAPGAQVTGVDPSARMLDAARARAARGGHARVAFAEGTLASIPAASASVDLLTAGYGFRNTPDCDAALAECARVLRPGGVLASLDFFRPANAAWRALFLGWLRVTGDVVGWWWHRTPAIYGYIARSIATFDGADAFATRCARHGFRVDAVETRLFGGIALHLATRTT
jgi:demethylmenaquinone methyltransferase/2-methoxy-6-polyprenyl-1,4-benzoquinol methylase